MAHMTCLYLFCNMPASGTHYSLLLLLLLLLLQ